MSTEDSAKEAELDYYIREFGEIARLNVSQMSTAKQILNDVFQRLSSYKATHN